MNPSPQRDPASLRRTIDSLTGELLAVYEELAVMYSMSAQFVRLSTDEQIENAALQQAMDVLRAECGWVAHWNGDAIRVLSSSSQHIDPRVAEKVTQAMMGSVRRHSGHLLSHDVGRDCRLRLPGAPLRFLASSLSTGLTSSGYLCLGRRRGNIFNSTDQKLLSSVASLTGIALENLRLQRSEAERQRLENELELARRIQQALLPHDLSRIDFLAANGVSLPCHEVGGDYMDLLSIDPDRSLAVIADVSGKGPAAALQAAMVQGIVHALCRQTFELPSLMASMNQCILARAIDGKFVTAILATISRSGRVQYVNGGHNAALWIPARGSVVQLTEGGPLLGFLEHARYPEETIQLARGDVLLLYTDGITDSDNAKEEPFGEDRLLDWASQQCGRSAAEVQESLLAAIATFCEGHPQADDLTFLALQYRGEH
jgi:serine phosphatase RsbU (regulator of sigma subunit)